MGELDKHIVIRKQRSNTLMQYKAFEGKKNQLLKKNAQLQPKNLILDLRRRIARSVPPAPESSGASVPLLSFQPSAAK